jgi:hypothetical protein
MKKYLIILLIINFIPLVSKACNVEKNLIGKSLQTIKEKYNLEQDLYNKSNFTILVRPNKIGCKKIAASIAEIYFTDNKISQVIFEKDETENRDLLAFAIKNWGENAHPLNDSLKSQNFADYWDKENLIINYKSEILDNKKTKETLIFTSKVLSKKLYEFQKPTE